MMEGRNVTDSNVRNESGRKKAFNKKKWREQKYNNTKKIEQWQERRKKNALHKYRKFLRRELNITDTSLNSRPRENDRDMKKSRYQQALEDYERQCQERKEKKQEALQLKAEKEAAREQANSIRAERQKKLSRRTWKGQPVMKERLEFLLEKIQKAQ